MKTTDLLASLAKEREASEKQLCDLETQRDEFERRCRVANQDHQRFDAEANIVEDLHMSVAKAFADVTQRSIAEELRLLEEGEEAVETDQSSERNVINAESVAAKIRHKTSSSRTPDEKHWVALDVLVNPTAYSHVTEMEAEEMKFDPDYVPRLRASDVVRILKLPRQLQLALPFLFSADEIDAHRLICEYTYEEGEARQKLLDSATYSSQMTDCEDPKVAPLITSAQHRLDLVLRQKSLSRIRTKMRDELTVEESKYLVIDRILNPYLYTPADSSFSIEVPCASICSHEAYGNKYDSMRKAYEAGASDEDLGFEEKWFPKKSNGEPHDRESLLQQVRNDLPTSGDEVEALLAKYYVSDQETPKHVQNQEIMQTLDERIACAAQRHRDIQQNLEAVRDEQTVDTKIETAREWGGWDVVHPASSGSRAQLHRFKHQDLTREHPASFSCVDLVSSSGKRSAQEFLKQPIVYRDLEDLSAVTPSEIKNATDVLFNFEGHETRLLSEEEQSLEAHASKAYYFQVPEEEDKRILSLTITIVYRGVFTARGYKLGRVAAAMFKIETASAVPKAIGYAPYEQQQLNTGTTLGRTIIVHKPDVVPLKKGDYKIVVGAASTTKFSVTVEAHAVQTAEAKLRDETARAHKTKNDLDVCKTAIEDMRMSTRLGERKLSLVHALIDESEVESSRCEREMERCNEELLRDDEQMELTDEERSNLHAEARRLEVEFAYWCRLFASRSQERRDLLKALDLLRKERAEKILECDRLDKAFKWLQRHLPPATCLICGMKAGVNSALSLNATFEFLPTENPRGQWKKLASAKGMITAMLTPAQEVRRRYRSEGWENLSLPEQQWTILDRTLNPEEYRWSQDSEHSDSERPHSASNADRKTERGENLKKCHQSIRAMKSFTAGELERIRKLPFDQLTRGNETTAWKLLRHFHSDPQRLVDYSKRRASVADSADASAVRSKDPKSLTREEREWVTIDKVLNPELWRGLKIRNDGTTTPYQNVLTAKQNSEYLKPFEHHDSALCEGSHIGNKFGSFVKRTMGEGTKQVEHAENTNSEDWACPLDRETLLGIWSERKHNSKWDVNECKARRLMEKYSGDFDVYAKLKAQIIERIDASFNPRHRFFDEHGNSAIPRPVEADLDARCRSLLAELDDAVANSNATMTSSILHGGVGQRFPTHILRLELEAELDALLREQVYERERAHRFLVEKDRHLSSSSSSDEESPARKTRKNTFSKDVYLTRRAILKDRNKNEETRQQERDLKELGHRACLACLSPTCEWKSSIDGDAVKQRLKVISDELLYVRMNPNLQTFESYVALSASCGGNPKFRRDDLIYELEREENELKLRLRLNEVDYELHNTYATRKEYMEVRALHAYPTLMWTSNARRALEHDHNRSIATLVASDVVNDILSWMFEGWYFGERKSSFTVAGYVPSLKADGFIRDGSDQILAQAVADRREQREDGATGSPRSKAEKIEVEAQFRLTNEKVVKAGSDREKHMDFTERTLKFGLFCITLMFFRAAALIQREKESWSGTHDVIGSVGESSRPSKERQRMRQEQQRTLERLKKLEVTMKQVKIGEERRRIRLAKEREQAARKLHAKVRREKAECVDFVGYISINSMTQACCMRNSSSDVPWPSWAKNRPTLGYQTGRIGGNECAHDCFCDYDRASISRFRRSHRRLSRENANGGVHKHDSLGRGSGRRR